MQQSLNELHQQARMLEQQHKQIKARTKILSRQIGIAKRDGSPVESLMSSMQEQSSQLKQLQHEMTDIEDRILEFFEPENAIATDSEPTAIPEKVELSYSQRYKQSTKNADGITISLLKNETDEWNEYVRNNPVTTIHHRAEWRQLLHQTYGLESYYFIARDQGRAVVGVLPLVRLKSRLFGDFLVSMPWFSRGGAVADHPLIEQKLMHAANKHAAALHVDHIEYRDDIPREQLPVQAHKVNMVLDLPGSEDELWKSFSSKLRAQIRRPQRENPQILTGSRELLNDFYAVYTRNMRDLGSPAHSKLLVNNLLQCFPDNSWIIVIRLNNRPVAAGLLLGQGSIIEIPLASTLRDVNALSINMLLYWEVLKFAIAHGYNQFDFGRSSKDAGTYRFKRQWGAQPKQLFWHYWLGEKGELPSLNPANPKYALVISLWKRLPLALTRWLGPRLVKHLP